MGGQIIYSGKLGQNSSQLIGYFEVSHKIQMTTFCLPGLRKILFFILEIHTYIHIHIQGNKSKILV